MPEVDQSVMQPDESNLIDRFVVGLAGVLQLKEPPLPDVIFHYTTAEGFLSIVETRKVRLVNSGYMHDRTELEFPFGLVRTAIRQAVDSTKDPRLRNILTTGESRVDAHLQTLPFYVASFSAASDKLSQWRAYCTNGGYCLGLRTAAIRKASGRKLLRRVVYSPSEQFRVLEELITEFQSIRMSASIEYEKVPNERFDGICESALRWMLQAAMMFFKSPAFEEEDEIRLATWNIGISEIGFFARGGQVVPFTELHWLETDPAIASVRVSPLASVSRAQRSAILLLQSHGYTNAATLVELPLLQLHP